MLVVLLFGRLGTVRNDFLLVLGVPLLDPFRANIMDSVRESYALTHIPTGWFAELTRAPIGKLWETVHESQSGRKLIRCFSLRISV